MEPAGRLTCEELLDHSYFDDDFKEKFEPELEVRTNMHKTRCMYILNSYIHTYLCNMHACTHTMYVLAYI